MRGGEKVKEHPLLTRMSHLMAAFTHSIPLQSILSAFSASQVVKVTKGAIVVTEYSAYHSTQ